MLSFPVSDYPAAENLYRRASIQRDVVSVIRCRWTKIRFIANNLGAWLSHCHMEWYMTAGLILAFIVSPDQLLAQGYTTSNSQQNVCNAA
ncbi:unnamed protein product [Rotaria socialis]|uniref:Plastocyanin-like domain-containing protein n=1 Tax=Rotaria socialis TaxID=392032 RepID=A0A821S3Z1_9BILA|nr:unnamed protein product [Rotaria socialis]CAF3648398.1 unnamed protein product [Rotaria socialis]CAF4257582.1 unnamed protein product [Rotaria socialis]CAF4299017.1 unnamed protein product [Rotaria socialis]CAF4540230.1 unnamed protein product [Rotaria socialis]